MRKIWFAADLHFSQKNIVNFKNYDGSQLRPFVTVEEHDEALVDNWNKVVGQYDRVYVLGDVAIARRGLQHVSRLKGKKVLIAGNHDVFKLKDYINNGFENIGGVKVLDHMILSHIPLSEKSITERFGTNVHGHLHGNVIDNPRYFSVSMEQINFTPISYEETLEKIKANYEKHGKPFPVYTKKEASPE